MPSYSNDAGRQDTAIAVDSSVYTKALFAELICVRLAGMMHSDCFSYFGLPAVAFFCSSYLVSASSNSLIVAHAVENFEQVDEYLNDICVQHDRSQDVLLWGQFTFPATHDELEVEYEIERGK